MRPVHTQAEEHDRLMDLLPLRTLCALCGWSYEGSAVEGREQAAQHRLQTHPDLVVQRRRPGRHLKSFRQPKLNKADWKEVYEERDRRARLLGIDIQEHSA